jgi:hypothetical protein
MAESRSEEKHEGEFFRKNQYAMQPNVGNGQSKFKQEAKRRVASCLWGRTRQNGSERGRLLRNPADST